MRTDWLVKDEEVKAKQRYHLTAFVKGYPLTWDDIKFSWRVVYSMLYQFVHL